MTITRIINGEEVLIELTTKEMSEAYGIIHRKELLEFVDFKLKEERPDIQNLSRFFRVGKKVLDIHSGPF